MTNKETAASWLAKQGPDSELARRLASVCDTPDIDLSWVFPIIARSLPAENKEYSPLFGLTAEEKEHAPPRTHDVSGKRIDGYGDPANGEYNAFLADDGGDIPCD